VNADSDEVVQVRRALERLGSNDLVVLGGMIWPNGCQLLGLQPFLKDKVQTAYSDDQDRAALGYPQFEEQICTSAAFVKDEGLRIIPP
jgi:hypothetical protein